MDPSIRFYRRRLSDLYRLDSHDAYHDYLICEGVQRYIEITSGNNAGSVLAVCANFREGENLSRFPFSKIVLSNIIGIDEFGDRMKTIMNHDSRISYHRENCENISFPSRSFDLVFCKEGLHHLSRPVQGLYEMLRICRKAVIFIEPWDSLASRILEVFGLTTYYEKHSGCRNNFVFRWNKRQLCMLLNSYYIDSGYQVDITLGWMSGRLLHDKPRVVKRIAYAIGVAVAILPGCRGNFATVLIRPGTDLPLDPAKSL